MEFIFELIFEIVGEILVAIFSEVIAFIAKYVDARTKVKKIIKYTVTYSILGLSILLIVLSLIYNKKLFVILAVSYLLIILIFNLVSFLNKDLYKNKIIDIFISVFRRIVHYSYPIILIVCAILYLDNIKAKTSLIIISAVAILIWLAIDMFKLWKYEQRKGENNKIKHLERYFYQDEYGSFEYPEGLKEKLRGKSLVKQLDYFRITSSYEASQQAHFGGALVNEDNYERIDKNLRIEGLILKSGMIVGIKVRTYLGTKECMLGGRVLVRSSLEDNGNGALMRVEEYMYLVSFPQREEYEKNN